MKYITLIFFTLILNSCSSQNKYEHFDYQNGPNAWINAFKDQMFFACLRESYSNDSIYKMIEKHDALNPYDGLNLESLDKAKALGKSIIKNIPPPAMCESCNNGENYFMADCLHYYKSRELDSIAHTEFKKFKALHE